MITVAVVALQNSPRTVTYQIGMIVEDEWGYVISSARYDERFFYREITISKEGSGGV